MDLLKIARVLKPQGIKGEMKLEPIIQDMDFFKKLKHVIIEGKTYTIRSSAARQGFAYIMVEGIVEPNGVEALRNKIVEVKREDAPVLMPDEFFIEDMLGVKVFDESGNEYGEITKIEQYGAADVYTITGRSGVHTFPFIKDMVISIDMLGKTMVVNAERLNEVMV